MFNMATVEIRQPIAEKIESGPQFEHLWNLDSFSGERLPEELAELVREIQKLFNAEQGWTLEKVRGLD